MVKNSSRFIHAQLDTLQKKNRVQIQSVWPTELQHLPDVEGVSTFDRLKYKTEINVGFEDSPPSVPSSISETEEIISTIVGVSPI